MAGTNMTSAKPINFAASLVETPDIGARNTPPISTRKEVATKPSASVSQAVSPLSSM